MQFIQITLFDVNIAAWNDFFQNAHSDSINRTRQPHKKRVSADPMPKASSRDCKCVGDAPARGWPEINRGLGDQGVCPRGFKSRGWIYIREVEEEWIEKYYSDCEIFQYYI